MPLPEAFASPACASVVGAGFKSLGDQPPIHWTCSDEAGKQRHAHDEPEFGCEWARFAAQHGPTQRRHQHHRGDEKIHRKKLGHNGTCERSPIGASLHRSHEQRLEDGRAEPEPPRVFERDPKRPGERQMPSRAPDASARQLSAHAVWTAVPGIHIRMHRSARCRRSEDRIPFMTGDTDEDRMSTATNAKAIAVDRNQRRIPFNMALLTFRFSKLLSHAASRKFGGEQDDTPWRWIRR